QQQRQSAAQYLAAVAPREDTVQLVLVTGLGRQLQGQLIAPRRIVRRLLLVRVALVLGRVETGHGQDVELQAVAEGEARRPQLAARAVREQRPQRRQQP